MALGVILNELLGLLARSATPIRLRRLVLLTDDCYDDPSTDASTNSPPPQEDENAIDKLIEVTAHALARRGSELEVHQTCQALRDK